MAHKQLIYKNPEVDLKKKYPRWVEWSLIFALLFTTSLFYSFQRFDASVELKPVVDQVIIIDPPIIPKSLKRPPAPQLPKKPVSSDDDEYPEDLPLDSLLFELVEINDNMKPPEEEEPVVPFHELSKIPKVIRSVNPPYPELAIKAGLEGKVVLEVLVGVKGEVEQVRIIKSNPMFDESAIQAAKQFKFTPAEQRQRLVKVWISIPFQFRLN